MLRAARRISPCSWTAPTRWLSRGDARLQAGRHRHASIFWIEFPDSGTRSRRGRQRLRQAVNYALDRSQRTSGLPRLLPPAGVIVPRRDGFRLQVPPHPYDPQKPGSCSPRPAIQRPRRRASFTPIPGLLDRGRIRANNLNAVGNPREMRLMERASFYAAWQEKKLRGLFLTAVGNSATPPPASDVHVQQGPLRLRRLSAPRQMSLQQSRERDPVKREAICIGSSSSPSTA